MSVNSEARPARRGTARAIERAVTFASTKGGTGKTSCVANIAGEAAAGGLKVLAVDLDPNGALHKDLGYAKHTGTELLDALDRGWDLPLLESVRPGLDVVPGGRAMEQAYGRILVSTLSDNAAPSMADRLWARLDSLVESRAYDLVLIDTSPGDGNLVEAAMSVSVAVVIPSKADSASREAVEGVAERFSAVLGTNPRLALAGAVLFDVGKASRRIERKLRTALEEMLGVAAPVFETRIRSVPGAAFDSREHGKLVRELDGEVKAAVAEEKAKLFENLRRGVRTEAKFTTRSASGLAEDYTNLTAEVLVRIRQLEDIWFSENGEEA